MIYLDNNATTNIANEVFEEMKPFLTEHFGNPSSAHCLAAPSRNAVETARESVAEFVGASDSSEIVFTSGGTESDNWAIFGTLESRPEKKKIIVSAVEHEAVRNVAKKLPRAGYDVTWIGVGENGSIDTQELRDAVDEDTALVSIMMANNETGVVFPVEELASIVRGNSDAVFHVDGVNAAGKIPIDLKNTEIDLFSISAHKFHGPKGVGALYVRRGVDIASNAIGGGQENGRRAGTEAVHQIVGIGAAARFVSDLTPMREIETLRNSLEKQILSTFPFAGVNGAGSKRIPNTSNISFVGLNGELILSLLDEHGICVSTGSACNEANHVASPVLRAMNVPYTKAMGAIRFSMGRFNTAAEIDILLERLPSIIGDVTAITA